MRTKETFGPLMDSNTMVFMKEKEASPIINTSQNFCYYFFSNKQIQLVWGRLLKKTYNIQALDFFVFLTRTAWKHFDVFLWSSNQY